MEATGPSDSDFRAWHLENGYELRGIKCRQTEGTGPDVTEGVPNLASAIPSGTFFGSTHAQAASGDARGGSQVRERHARAVSLCLKQAGMLVAATSGDQFIWTGFEYLKPDETVDRGSPGQWPLRVSWIGAQVPGRSILGADQRERPGPMSPEQ
ncbi:hypothetical protein FALBO_15107 [Fusarium albosuccineum]|uniref:Uncharacterized protein n=1 Tax=Fusarium albosuccineum TaxID=1237068 RepID=A0A8H4PEV6_9HYPO|nr:hypothetical protein FALBO_15107 [Fusarium albosuccineum]